jgi:hypothetical protein
MKVSKHTVANNKIVDEENLDNEEALADYLKHSVYHGHMIHEEARDVGYNSDDEANEGDGSK